METGDACTATASYKTRCLGHRVIVSNALPNVIIRRFHEVLIGNLAVSTTLAVC